MKDLLVKRLAVAARGCHGDDEIFFIRESGCKTELLIDACNIHKPVIDHPVQSTSPSAFWTHKTLRICRAQPLGRGRQMIWVDDLICFEFAI